MFSTFSKTGVTSIVTPATTKSMGIATLSPTTTLSFLPIEEKPIEKGEKMTVAGDILKGAVSAVTGGLVDTDTLKKKTGESEADYKARLLGGAGAGVTSFLSSATKSTTSTGSLKGDFLKGVATAGIGNLMLYIGGGIAVIVLLIKVLKPKNKNVRKR